MRTFAVLHIKVVHAPVRHWKIGVLVNACQRKHEASKQAMMLKNTESGSANRQRLQGRIQGSGKQQHRRLAQQYKVKYLQKEHARGQGAARHGSRQKSTSKRAA